MKFRQDHILAIIKTIQEKGFFHLLSANLLIQVFAFASQLFVAGILSPDDIGRIKIIQTYVSIFSFIAGMGFNTSTLKLCSETRSFEEQIILFKSALHFTFISTISLYILIIFLNYFSLFSSDKLIQWLIPIGFFPLISNSFFLVFNSFFQANLKIKLLSKLTITNKIVSILAILIFTYWGGIKGYYIAYNISFILMLFICISVFKSTFKVDFFNKKNDNNFNLHWKYAKPLMLTNLFAEMSVYVDILLIGLLNFEMKQIGYYSFALTLTIVLRIIPDTVQQITSPYFSTISENIISFKNTFKKYNKILFWNVLLTYLVSCLVLPFIIHFVFNGKYDESIKYFPILAIGLSLRQFTRLQSSAIFGLGKMRYNVYISLISLLFNIFAISIALYYFGLMGAAYASIPCGLIHVLASRYYYKKAESEM